MAAPTLAGNQNENPLFDSIDIFLQSQLHQEGMMIVIDKLEITTKWTSNVLKLVRDNRSRPIFYKERFKFSPESDQDFGHLKAYLFNMLVAQSFESLESLLKKLVKEIDHSVRENVSNRERLSMIDNFIQNVDIPDDVVAKLQMIEEVRHRVVHTDQQIISTSKKKISNQKLFKEFYSTIRLSTTKKRIKIEFKDAVRLNKFMTSLGYRLFSLVSEKFQYPIKIVDAD